MTDKNGKRVVMFAAEAAPFVKVGGLADVVGSLPKVLEGLGAQLTLVLPAYQVIRHEKFGIKPDPSIDAFAVPMGTKSVQVEVGVSTLPDSGVRVYFVGGGGYFSRDGVYDDPVTNEGYQDNAQRYSFFAKAGIELLRRMGDSVDVVHCHDSQTGLIPALLQTVYRGDSFYARIGTLFTIHNAAYQGLYPKEILTWAGVDASYFHPSSPFEFWGKVNLLKAGIETADLVNTVSVTYAREIQSDPAYGCGLEGTLKSRARDLFGILNGIDYDVWNPETDPLIPAHDSNDDWSGKAICKANVLTAMKLPQPEGRKPLIGIVSRLAEQKGLELIAEAIDRIVELDLQIALLGTGQPEYHALFREISARHRKKFAIRLRFDNRLAHQIEAGADMFLMPSKYEPCGLNQLYSLRYGTVPIVRATGGLADTIADDDPSKDSGTGFVFREFSAEGMLTAIERALAAFADEKRWRRLAVRGMAQRWTWEDSALKYLQLYEKITNMRRS